MMTRFRIALLALVIVHDGAFAAADYPNKPIRLVVPFGAGGNGDVLARLLAEKMGAAMKQSVIVDNRVGVGGSIAATEVAHAAPDGYTLLLATSSTHGINPAVYHNLKYDALRDFAPITMVALSEYALVVPATSPFKSVGDLLRADATQPLRYASSGNGTTSHLASALLSVKTGATFVHVPYKSGPAAMQDVMGGQVDFLIDNASSAVQNAHGGRLRILATTGATRGAATRDIPTLAESGVPGYEIVGWWALVAPAGTPAAIVDRLNREVVRAVDQPDARAKMNAMGNPADTRSPAETRAYIASELKSFKTLVDAVGLKID